VREVTRGIHFSNCTSVYQLTASLQTLL